MSRQDFLQPLREALLGEVPGNVIEENIRYYYDYISTEVRKGSAENEVIASIGDPRLIAKTIMEASINQTLSRTVLTSLTTLLCAVALYVFGGPAINDFAFTLLVGFSAGIYSTVFVAGALAVDWKTRFSLRARKTRKKPEFRPAQ